MPHSELFIEGVWYPSVTTIIGSAPKPYLDKWRVKWGVLAERKMKIASAIGTEFHRCVDAWLSTRTYTVAPPMIDGFSLPTTIARVEGMMMSFIGWAMNVDGVINHTEIRVISHTYTYSGTLDAVGYLGGRPMVFDWKTSSQIYDDMQLQLAAYAHAYNEQHTEEGKPIKEGIIVHVSKDKPRFKVTTKLFKLGKRPFKQFLKLREKFNDIQKREGLNAEISNGEAAGC